MEKIFLASGNKKKIDELKGILEQLDLGIELVSIKDGVVIPEVVEDRDSFQGNSEKKATEIGKYLNMITISDDSGLCVEGLDGAPGVYSARYAGEGATDIENNEKLIKDLNGVANRKCKFVCVISLGLPDGRCYSYSGELFGEIVDEARGADGFGYDPHFYMKEYRKTLAEMPELKNKISHRAIALRKLAAELPILLKNKAL